MQLHEMEEQLRKLDARTTAIEQILPTLATRDDLHLTTAALQHEIETGFQEAKKLFQEARNRADRLNEVTREQIRLVVTDVQQLRREMAAMRDDLRGEMAAMKD